VILRLAVSFELGLWLLPPGDNDRSPPTTVLFPPWFQYCPKIALLLLAHDASLSLMLLGRALVMGLLGGIFGSVSGTDGN